MKKFDPKTIFINSEITIGVFKQMVYHRLFTFTADRNSQEEMAFEIKELTKNGIQEIC